jgi:uncharacterized protein DUF6962
VRVSLAEPDVALTDFAIALEGAVLGALVHARGSNARVRRWWAAFFWAVAVGALLGGVSHGFPPAHEPMRTAIWRLTLLAIGVGALCAWGAGAHAIAAARRRLVLIIAAGLFVVYATVVLFVTDAFGVAIVHYAAGAAFLLVVLMRVWFSSGPRSALVGALGIVMLAVGSLVQWRRWELPTPSLTPNAVYHVIEMAALVLLYVAARGLTSTSARC